LQQNLASEDHDSLALLQMWYYGYLGVRNGCVPTLICAQVVLFQSPDVDKEINGWIKIAFLSICIWCCVLLYVEQEGNSVSQTSDQRQMATLKNQKIKIGICRRTLKKLHSYESEVEQESAKTNP